MGYGNHALRVATSLYLIPLLLALGVSESALAEFRLRAMTGNITSGNAQSYDEGHGIRIFQAFAPQVALVQEMNYRASSPADIRAFVDEAFGKRYHYYREPAREGAIPNGIVSEWPILESGSLKDPTIDNRGIAWARIELPEGKTLWAFSGHFSHDGSGRRSRAAEVVLDFVMKRAKGEDFLLFGADGNFTNRKEPAMELLKKFFSDAQVPVGAEGRDGTNTSRSKPYDVLLPNRALEKHHICVEILTKGGNSVKFPHGLVFDSRSFKPLSAVPPVQAGDSAAKNMQHMAIVKDFLIR